MGTNLWPLGQEQLEMIRKRSVSLAIIRQIFKDFVEKGHSESKIAQDFNHDRIESPSGRRWVAGGIRIRLRNEKYTGSFPTSRRPRLGGTSCSAWSRLCDTRFYVFGPLPGIDLRWTFLRMTQKPTAAHLCFKRSRRRWSAT